MRIDNDSHYSIVLIALIFAWAGLAGCTSPDSNPVSGTFIATTGIIGDVVANVAGDEHEVSILIPAGVDPHDYAPSAQQVASISAASFVFANGLGLEEGLIDLLEQAETEGISVEYLAEQVEPLGDDPHFWHDPLRMSDAAGLIAQSLGATSSYPEELESLHREVEGIVGIIPPERRLLVTGHDSFGYFAARYGFDIIGTIIPGGGSLGSPSSADLAALVDLIESNDVPAIFVENTSSPELAEILAAEVGRPVEVVGLAGDALGEPGSETGTYVDLIRFNARAIAAALGS